MWCPLGGGGASKLHCVQAGGNVSCAVCRSKRWGGTMCGRVPHTRTVWSNAAPWIYSCARVRARAAAHAADAAHAKIVQRVRRRKGWSRWGFRVKHACTGRLKCVKDGACNRFQERALHGASLHAGTCLQVPACRVLRTDAARWRALLQLGTLHVPTRLVLRAAACPSKGGFSSACAGISLAFRCLCLCACMCVKGGECGGTQRGTLYLKRQPVSAGQMSQATKVDQTAVQAADSGLLGESRLHYLAGSRRGAGGMLLCACRQSRLPCVCASRPVASRAGRATCDDGLATGKRGADKPQVGTLVRHQ
ncbi:MAG: hypothetical protein J3K34DRAFT_417843 [Monoraphidium minutum]|nr:MAG: hypothetical protein J3K34DRAFT_417843 [Monoraphidium minutum]